VTAKPQFVAGVTFFVMACLLSQAHDITTRVTWDREISRIFYARCASCHRPGGSAFSLTTYSEVGPWATAIKTEVLQRRMPPWGAVKGFGTFRNEQALGQEELDLIAKWVDGGVPEGNPADLPLRPSIPDMFATPSGRPEVVATGEYRFDRPFTLDAFRVVMPKGAAVRSAQITIELPDGRVEPLVWLHEYAAGHEHPFELRTPMQVPQGSVLRGVPAGSSLALIPKP
jgi:hypothetical protein